MGQKGPKAKPMAGLFKMKYQNEGGAKALMKALIGDQNRLPENLKKAIKDAPESPKKEDAALKSYGSKDKALRQEGPDPKKGKQITLSYLPESGDDPYDITVTENSPYHKFAMQQAQENFGDDFSGKLTIPGGIVKRGYTANTDPAAAGLSELQVAERTLLDAQSRPGKYGSKENSNAFIQNMKNKINRMKKVSGK